MTITPKADNPLIGFKLIKRSRHGDPLYAVTINGECHKSKLMFRASAEYFAQQVAAMGRSIYIGEHA